MSLFAAITETQSVRVRPLSRAQSTGGGRPPRPSAVGQRMRDRASEMRSMTRAQAEKKYRWEVIAKELESMQKKNT